MQFVIIFHGFDFNFSLIFSSYCISIMLYTPKIADYLKILTDEKVRYFVVINFGECSKSTREKLYSKLQSWTKYLRQTLVFVSTREYGKSSISIFQKFFASIEKAFILGERLSSMI